MFKALLDLYVLWVEKTQCNLNKILISYVITKGWQVQLEKCNMVLKIWIHFAILYHYKITLNANMIKNTHK